MKKKDSPEDNLMRGYRSSATSLLFTILRAVEPVRAGPVWTGTLVNALGACGVQERNARQAIARIAERDNLRPEKVGARTRWHITERGHTQIRRASRRFHDARIVQEDWDGQWLVVICSVPEEQREKRRMFRSHLTSHGCAFVGPGVAVCTHVEREPAIIEVLREFGLEAGAIIFRARTGEVLGDRDLLARAWDFNLLAAEYREFIAEFVARRPVGEQERFAAFAMLEHEWFHFVMKDPELPRALLPDPWIGEEAKRLFSEKHAQWRIDALAWFDRTDASFG